MSNTKAPDFFNKKEIPPPWEHQEKTKTIGLEKAQVLDLSDPGTGKTRAWLEVLSARLKISGGKALVLATKSTMKSAWADDITRFTPELTFSIAYASNREKAFAKDADVYIINHDGIKWIDKNQKLVFTKERNFESLVIDEITAYKHQTSQRSKAMGRMAKKFKYRCGLTGTPVSNGILDIWHPMKLVDDGKRLGASYFKFRNTVCEPVQVGPDPTKHIKWVDREGSVEAVTDLLSDITVRHVFEKCVSIPPHNTYFKYFELNPKHRKAYEMLKEHSVVPLESGELTGFNRGIVTQKLLQLASGAVYATPDTECDRITEVFTTERYELVGQLVEERDQCVVAFAWKHQKEELLKEFEKRKITTAVLDGTITSDIEREETIASFQRGEIKALLIHPKTGAHGLTLTAGTSTIWPSPIYDAELFTQFNKRIYRGGQKRKTETVMVTAKGTIDEEVYDILRGKIEQMDTLLEMVAEEF
tara:strand:+ start:14093 stop:15517 length:1425 start_codon:yes stop_codon:yes gene_type:complete